MSGPRRDRVALPASGGSLSGCIPEHWTAAPYFVVADPASRRFEAFSNPSYGSRGCPVERIADLLARRGVACLLADRVQPEERELLRRRGIEVLAGFRGRLDQALERHAAARGD